MIGLDTNVIVRYVAQDDALQSARAVKFIEKECTSTRPGFISLVTLVELVWVSESCYGATKTEISALIRRILGIKQLVVQAAEIVWKSLLSFDRGKADFADYLVKQIGDSSGCSECVTFDKTAAKAGMSLLKQFRVQTIWSVGNMSGVCSVSSPVKWRTSFADYGSAFE